MKLEDYSKYYIQGSDHYLVPKNEFVELFNEMINWKQENEKLKARLELFENGVYFSRENDRLEEENEELKKQLEELREQAIIDTLDLQTHKYQQQEFIKYLEDCIKEYTPNLKINEFDEDGNRITQYINAEVFNKQPIEVLKEILQKYKEILGGNKDE